VDPAGPLVGVAGDGDAGGQRPEQQGDGEFTPLWSGQAASLAREMPAQALTLALAQEAVARFKQMTG